MYFHTVVKAIYRTHPAKLKLYTHYVTFPIPSSPIPLTTILFLSVSTNWATLMCMSSHSVVSDSATPRTAACQDPVHGDSPGKNTAVGCHALLQGILPTQGLNPGLPNCRWTLYYLSHQGSPFFMWVESYSMSLWLVYFTQHNVLKVHLCCNMFQNFPPF